MTSNTSFPKKNRYCKHSLCVLEPFAPMRKTSTLVKKLKAMPMAEDSWPWLLQGDPQPACCHIPHLELGMAEREAEKHKLINPIFPKMSIQ